MNQRRRMPITTTTSFTFEKEFIYFFFNKNFYFVWNDCLRGFIQLFDRKDLLFYWHYFTKKNNVDGKRTEEKTMRKKTQFSFCWRLISVVERHTEKKTVFLVIRSLPVNGYYNIIYVDYHPIATRTGIYESIIIWNTFVFSLDLSK
jgi:hypothetical protein